MLSELASAISAGTLFHSEFVWLVNKKFAVVCSRHFLSKFVPMGASSTPIIIIDAKIVRVTATSPCTTLYISVRRWSCRRASNIGHFNLACSSVMLACCRRPTPLIHLMARFWIFSEAYLSLLGCGSHIVAAYSAVDLNKLEYAVCFSCVGHFLIFLRINPRPLLHLFAVIVMWSEKCKDLCNNLWNEKLYSCPCNVWLYCISSSSGGHLGLYMLINILSLDWYKFKLYASMWLNTLMIDIYVKNTKQINIFAQSI